MSPEMVFWRGDEGTGMATGCFFSFPSLYPLWSVWLLAPCEGEG